MKLRFIGLASLVAVVLLSPNRNVEACGPDFEPEVFVSATTPDDIPTFASGQLGILQSGYDSNEYAVAWRYLNGGNLSAPERAGYTSPVGASETEFRNGDAASQIYMEQNEKDRMSQEPSGQWLLERAKYAQPNPPEDQKSSSPADYVGTIIIYDENYLNCPDPAFSSATLTLKSRANTWGPKSQWLANWIHAQDAVFSNCDGKAVAIPVLPPADGPELLKADRAYQVASATFYAKQFDDAARQFAAIAADHNSPWSQWGDYLAARATIRKAFAMGKPTDGWSEVASFDLATMQRAQQMLEAILARPNPTPSREVVQNELNLVLIRTDPQKRADALCAALTGPAPDPNFSTDMQDLSWLLENHVKIENEPPLLAWIAAWRGSGTASSSYALWQHNHSLPWLLMAMVKAGPADSFAPDLINEAAKIAPESPAYDTAFYHRVRILIALNRADEARALLDKALVAPNLQKPSSKRNALLGERMAVARNFSEFLAFAPRYTLETGSEGAEELRGQCEDRARAVNVTAPCPEADHPLEFDQDAVQILNQQTPVSLLIQAANTPSLPLNLRQNVVVVAWTRSVLLEDSKSAATLAPLLPKPLHDAVGSSIGFPADLAILRNPGIRPYLEAGVPRVASYSYFDVYRDNWWSDRWTDPYTDTGEQTKPAPLTAPSFLAPGDLAKAAAESQHLHQPPGDFSVICQRVIDFAKQHPDDPQVPEALALVVHATRYSPQTWEPGDSGHEFTPVSKTAFELLHQRYPKSPWTAKTPYYY
jgi:hypothetical protein